ncbi:MAG TPA: G5 domain-containing protein [Candidatus Saccharimonadales bacterium]|nr:G5 domain-containing protein [Candidatus Saccharimonadales bacterium]
MQKFWQKLQVKLLRARRVHWPRRVRKFKILSRHPSFKVPAITIGLLVLLTAIIFVVALQTHHLPQASDAKIVVISHDGTQQTVPVKETTVGQLLQKLHIPLNRGDVVEPDLTTKINQDEFRINIYRAVPVEIIDGTQHTFGLSAAKTLRSVAAQVGANIYPEDIPNSDPTDSFLNQGAIGERIVVDRATPVNVDLYGAKVVLRTHTKTVADLVKEKGIRIIKGDKVVPALTTPITENMQLAFIRTGIKTVTVNEAIKAPVNATYDSGLAYGTTAVRQQGSDGQQTVTYKIVLKNNVEVGRKIIQKVVTRQPVTEIVVVGTSLGGIKGDMALAGISSRDYQYADYIISHESGWCPTKIQGQYGGCEPLTGGVPDYGGYGLCQSTPGYKMASAGSDWRTNPITQLRWCSGYASAHYGGWANAYSFWINNHYW